MTLIIPETPEEKKAEEGNRKYRRMLASRQAHVEQHNKKMTAFFRRVAEKRQKRLTEQQKKLNEAFSTPTKNTGTQPS